MIFVKNKIYNRIVFTLHCQLNDGVFKKMPDRSNLKIKIRIFERLVYDRVWNSIRSMSISHIQSDVLE